MEENNYQQNNNYQNNQNFNSQQFQNQDPYQNQSAPPQKEKASVGLAILSFIIPIAGLIIFIVNKKKKPKTAKVSGICALVSIILGVIMVAVSGNGTNESTNNSVTNTDSSYSENIQDSQQSQQENSEEVKAENNNSSDNNLGDFNCTVKGAELTKDWTGAEAVLITYDFTNNSNDAISFDVALQADAYQDGVGLETAILDEDTDIWDVEIKPGVTKEVKKAYVLRDTATPVEIEVSELISFSDDKITTTVELQ